MYVIKCSYLMLPLVGQLGSLFKEREERHGGTGNGGVIAVNELQDGAN